MSSDPIEDGREGVEGLAGDGDGHDGAPLFSETGSVDTQTEPETDGEELSETEESPPETETKPLTHLFDLSPRLASLLADKKVFIFLDYDGTLTPIVSDPSAAHLSEEMRELLSKLADLCTIGIVTGRSMKTIKDFVKIQPKDKQNFMYAASHGFDIETGRRAVQHQVGEQYVPFLKRAAGELHERLKHVEGFGMEDNHYAVSAHYRNVDPSEVPFVESCVDEVIARYPCLKKSFGKCVFELRINVNWDKGRAVLWLLEASGVSAYDDSVFLVYAGDDVTDEDAFRALRSSSGVHSSNVLSVLVSREERPTAASHILSDPKEVLSFLSDVFTVLSGGTISSGPDSLPASGREEGEDGKGKGGAAVCVSSSPSESPPLGGKEPSPEVEGIGEAEGRERGMRKEKDGEEEGERQVPAECEAQSRVGELGVPFSVSVSGCDKTERETEEGDVCRGEKEVPSSSFCSSSSSSPPPASNASGEPQNLSEGQFAPHEKDTGRKEDLLLCEENVKEKVKNERNILRGAAVASTCVPSYPSSSSFAASSAATASPPAMETRGVEGFRGSGSGGDAAGGVGGEALLHSSSSPPPPVAVAACTVSTGSRAVRPSESPPVRTPPPPR